jgi:hypothetical protein
MLCDHAYNSDVADLFTEDAILEAGPFGSCSGREEIRRYFTRLPDAHAFSLHYISNPEMLIFDGRRL